MKKLKKLLPAFMVAVAVLCTAFAFAACDGSSDNNPPDSTSPTTVYEFYDITVTGEVPDIPSEVYRYYNGEAWFENGKFIRYFELTGEEIGCSYVYENGVYYLDLGYIGSMADVTATVVVEGDTLTITQPVISYDGTSFEPSSVYFVSMIYKAKAE